MPVSSHFITAGDGGGVIFIIMVIFWIISSVSQKIREGKEAEKRKALLRNRPAGTPPPPPPPPPPARSLNPEEELRRFLEEMTRRKSPPPTPAPAPAQVPPPAARRKEPAPVIVFDKPAPVLHAPAAPANAYTQTTHEIGSIHEADAYASLGEIEDIEKLMERQTAQLYSGETMIRPDGMLVNLSKIRVPLMTLPLVSYKSVRHSTARPPLKSDRQALKQALVARVVLGPCKAFGDDFANIGQSGR